MNRTLKDATVIRYYYESHDQLREHLAAFLAAYNFAKRLKTLRGPDASRIRLQKLEGRPSRFPKRPDPAHPGTIQLSDNGPSYISAELAEWLDERLAKEAQRQSHALKQTPSGSNLTVESFGIPVEARALLRDAHRKIHHLADRSAAAQRSHQRSQRSAEARLAG